MVSSKQASFLLSPIEGLLLLSPKSWPVAQVEATFQGVDFDIHLCFYPPHDTSVSCFTWFGARKGFECQKLDTVTNQ